MNALLAQTTETQISGGAAAGFGIFLLIFWAVGIVNFVFWILSLIHLIQHDDVHDRVLWLIVVLLVPFGPLIYFFGPKKKYDKGQQAPTAASTTAAPTETVPPAETPATPPGSTDENQTPPTPPAA